jgi:hypothetical protein
VPKEEAQANESEVLRAKLPHLRQEAGHLLHGEAVGFLLRVVWGGLLLR